MSKFTPDQWFLRAKCISLLPTLLIYERVPCGFVCRRRIGPVPGADDPVA